MTVERIDPPLVAQEREMLDAWLDYHRATLALKCEGLTDDQLRARAVPPSSLSLLGLVRHMGEVERSWFRRVLGGEQVPPPLLHRREPGRGLRRRGRRRRGGGVRLLAGRVRACPGARRGGAIARCDRHPGGKRAYSLRWIMVHMIEEYARHNGHADLLRERIDGTVGD